MPDVNVTVKQTNITVETSKNEINVQSKQGESAQVSIEEKKIIVEPSQNVISVEQGQIIKIDKEQFVMEKFTDLSGVNQHIDFENKFRSNSLSLFYNGVLMEKTVSYTEDVDREGATILIELETSDKLEARYVKD